MVNLTSINYINDLELDNFGVDVQVLKDPVILREFVGRTEDWEKDLKKKNSPVVEEHFLTKYKNLSFLFKDNYIACTIYEGNIEFHRGKTYGLMLIGECSEEGVEDEDFCPFLFVILVSKYPHAEGVKIHQPLIGCLEEKQYYPD